jgi:hypothetical protein
MCASEQNAAGCHPYLLSGVNMKKLLAIAFLALSLAGCLDWPHWGGKDNRDRHEQQRNEQRDHPNRGR